LKHSYAGLALLVVLLVALLAPVFAPNPSSVVDSLRSVWDSAREKLIGHRTKTEAVQQQIQHAADFSKRAVETISGKKQEIDEELARTKDFVKEKGSEFKEAVSQRGHEGLKKAEELGDHLREATLDAKQYAYEKAQKVSDQIVGKTYSTISNVEDLGHVVSDKLHDSKAAVQEAKDHVFESAEHLAHDLRRAATEAETATKESADSMKHYLQREGGKIVGRASDTLQETGSEISQYLVGKQKMLQRQISEWLHYARSLLVGSSGRVPSLPLTQLRQPVHVDSTGPVTTSAPIALPRLVGGHREYFREGIEPTRHETIGHVCVECESQPIEKSTHPLSLRSRSGFVNLFNGVADFQTHAGGHVDYFLRIEEFHSRPGE